MAVIILTLVFRMTILDGAGHFVYTNKAVEARLPRLGPEARVQNDTLHDPAGRQAKLDDMVREGILAFSVNATPVIENGRAKVNLPIENPSDSGNRFTASISREDTGEESYQSGYLDPEQYIGSVPLDRKLPAGKYPCLAYIDAHRISDNAYIGGTTARITLFVQS